MALISNAEVWFAKLDPEKPNNRLDPKNPTWEVQIRTDDPKQKKEWEDLGLKPKLMIYKSGDQEGEPILNERGKKQWKLQLKKKTINNKGEKSDPPTVVNGALKPIDPTSVGNGSIANIRVYLYDYKNSATGAEGKAAVLMALQVVKHVVYVPAPREDDFAVTTTEVVNPVVESTPVDTGEDGNFEDMEDDIPFDGGVKAAATTTKPAAPSVKPRVPTAPARQKPVDVSPEDEF